MTLSLDHMAQLGAGEAVLTKLQRVGRPSWPCAILANTAVVQMLKTMASIAERATYIHKSIVISSTSE